MPLFDCCSCLFAPKAKSIKVAARTAETELPAIVDPPTLPELATSQSEGVTDETISKLASMKEPCVASLPSLKTDGALSSIISTEAGEQPHDRSLESYTFFGSVAIPSAFSVISPEDADEEGVYRPDELCRL